jgi:5'-deoxynucleotidase YfbR-like HD superfamily hydrolase
MNLVNDLNIHTLNNIQRYNTTYRIQNESVASHSFIVVYFIHRLCTEFKLYDNIKLMALEAGLLHDIPEVIINDITHDAKELITGLPALLQPYEEEVIKAQSERAWQVLFHPADIEQQIAQAVVNHADIISVWVYCDNEVKLGNKHFESLLFGSKQRLDASITTLSALVSTYHAQQRKIKKEKTNNAKE